MDPPEHGQAVHAEGGARRELAKVVLLTKDEPALIGDFLAHYAALFGAHNIVVVDNGSSDPRVLAAYDAYRPRGTRVVVDTRPFPEAVHWMSEHIAALRGACEWVLPLETDEFLFLPDAAPDARVTAEAVADRLRAVPAGASVVRYGAFYGCVPDPADAGFAAPPAGDGYTAPARQATRFYDQGWDKIIVRADAFARMRQWCHHAEVTRGVRVVSAALGLLHFHETGFKRQVDSAVAVIRGFGYVDLDAPLAEQLRRTALVRAAGVACGHKVEYYDALLRRRMVLGAFRRLLGRLPSLDELLRYADPSGGGGDDPELRVRADLDALRRAAPPAPPEAACWDALLYHEPRREHAQVREVRQVARTLRALDEAPEAAAKAEAPGAAAKAEAPEAAAEAEAGPPPAAPEEAEAEAEAAKAESDGDGDGDCDGEFTFPELPLATAAPPKLSEVLARHASAHNATGTDKTTSHAYGELYDAVLGPLRDRARRVLPAHYRSLPTAGNTGHRSVSLGHLLHRHPP